MLPLLHLTGISAPRNSGLAGRHVVAQSERRERFFPHLAPTPLPPANLQQQPHTTRQTTTSKQYNSSTLPSVLAPLLTSVDSSTSSVASAPVSSSTKSPTKKRKKTKKALEDEPPKKADVKPNAEPEEKTASKHKHHVSISCTEHQEPTDLLTLLEQQTPTSQFNRDHVDQRQQSPPVAPSPHFSPTALAASPRSSARSSPRMSPAIGTRAHPTASGAGQGAPAHVRRVSVNIQDVLESPRMRKIAPSAAAQTPATPQRIGSAANKRIGSASTNRIGSASLRRPSVAPPAALAPDQKPCSVLLCGAARVSLEGYCLEHLADSRAGVKLRHQRSGSVLMRILQPNAMKPINSGGYGAARAHHSTEQGGSQMHERGIGARHGLADICAYKILGISEEGDEATEVKAVSHRPKLATGSANFVPRKLPALFSATSMKTMPSISDAKGGLHQRRFSQSKPTSNSSDWMHSPAAQAARLLRITSKPSRPTIMNDAQRAHTREMSHGLPVEPLPAVDMSLAQLPFCRFYFDLPASLGAFISFRDSVSNTPEGAVVSFLIAMLIWSEGKDAAEREDLRQRLGIDADADKARLRQVAALAAAARMEHLTALPVHVIANASRRSVDTKPPKTPSDGNSPTRLQSFQKRPVNEKKLNFKRSDEEGKQNEEQSANAAASAAVAIDTSVEWSMDTRWMALIASVHTDQTVEWSPHNVELAIEETSISFRNRSLCVFDINGFNDSFDVCPHLARSFVLGTVPLDRFALPSHIPPLTPLADKRKMNGTLTEDHSLMSEGCGSLVVRLARHPFAEHGATANTFALVMVHCSGLRYPKSVKLRRDQTGRWRVAHWWNLLCEVPLAEP